MIAPIEKRKELKKALDECERILLSHPHNTFAQIYKWNRKKFNRVISICNINISNRDIDYIAHLFIGHKYSDGRELKVGLIRSLNFPSSLYEHTLTDDYNKLYAELEGLQVVIKNLEKLANSRAT